MLDPDGRQSPDLRAYSWQPADGGGLRLRITNPSSCWGRAGLHTGERLLTVNGAAVRSSSEFRQMLGRLHPGDSVSVVVERLTGIWQTVVRIAGYQRAVVQLEELPGASEKQRKLRRQWMEGEPLLNLE